MNLWHDVPFGTPEAFNVIVEVPHGSHNKYEIDKDTGLISLDRANYSDAPYPFNYCFVPQTLWEDGDAIDVMLISTYPIDVGILVPCRAVGLMNMIDSGESDDKIVAVPTCDKRFDHIQEVQDFGAHNLRDWAHFFETYKALKGKSKEDYIVTVPGYKPKADALAALEKSRQLYSEKFGK